MFSNLPPLKALRAFEAAARHLSFTRAANELCVTQGAISYQIRQLESRLDFSLFHRSIRSIQLSTQGEQLYRTVHRHFNELELEINKLSATSKQQEFTVAVSTFFATRWLSPRLGEFLIKYPGITLGLQHSVNDPDFTIDEVALAIRWGSGEWSNVESELLFPLPTYPLCAPKLVNGPKPLKQLQDISDHKLLRDQPGIDRWSEWLTRAGIADLATSSAIIVDQNVRIQSAIDGHGVLLGNDLIKKEIEDGSLVTPLTTALDDTGFFLVCARNQLQRESFKIFHDWIKSII